MTIKKFIGIFAPYPRVEHLTDGWYRRIHIIDSILDGIPRIYINTIHQANIKYPVITHNNNVKEIFLDPTVGIQSEEIRNLLADVCLSYVHTTHIGEDFMKLKIQTPFIIDFHGVAPEEELAEGNLKKAERLESVERFLYSNSMKKVYVSPGMQTHFELKYGRADDYLELPIISEIRLDKLSFQNTLETPKEDSYVYSGGLQSWQNIPEMMQVVERLEKSFTIATNQTSEFGKVLKENLKSFCTVGKYEKQNLLELYVKSSFGYVIRDDTTVNQVAFPTKLFEYLACGVIPIVKFSDLGGLSRFGMFSISVGEIADHKYSVNELTQHRLNNYKISENVINRFLVNAASLRRFVNQELFR